MIIGDTYKYLVRIRHKDEQGTGIIYFPEDGNNDIIITAKHVIKDVEDYNIQIDKLLKDDGSFTDLNLNGRTNIKIERCEDADLACILFPKGEISNLIGESCNLIALDRRFDFKKCISIGYPKENDALKVIHSEFRTYSEDPPFVIESKIAPQENLKTLGLDSYDSVVGMSGGGLFYSDGANVYLAGVLFEFKDAYKDYHSIDIGKVNSSLLSKGISGIPVTYASSFGINEDWIHKHLTSARKNLGERYTTAIENLDVPEAEYLRYLEVGDSFRRKLGEKYHELIEDLRRDLYCLRNNDFTKELHTYIESLIPIFKASYHDTDWVVHQFSFGSFPFELIEEALGVLEKWETLIRDEQSRIYKERKEKKQEELYYNREEPLRSEYNKVRLTERNVRNFRNYLKGKHIRLSLDPKVLITGKAGKGKSHLLGDTVMTRLDELKPSIFILGQQLGSNNNPREQILGRLELSGKCDFNRLIIVLNQIGKFLNERFFFVIDALNEGNGKQFWINEIAGLIEDFDTYPHVALVFSVRSTYIDDVIPEELQNTENLTQIEHHGFEGQELEAVQYFCRNFELEEPGIPLLAPEFSNPLFLLLFCKALKANGVTKFPKGINGISEVYRSHTQSVSNALNKEFQFRLPKLTNIVEAGINYLLKLGSDYRGFRLSEVQEHFAVFKMCNGLHLLNGMLRDNILTDDISYFSQKEPKVKVVRFSYERYANHAFVKSQLDKSVQNPNHLLQKGGYLFETALKNKQFDEGILESFAIQLPERFNIELHELMTQNWLDQFDFYSFTNDNLQALVIESFQWRTIDSIPIKKTKNFINQYLSKYYMDDDLFRILFLLAPNEDHPLNANYLHQHLAPLSMPDRDSFWLGFIHQEFNDPKSSLSRLIDWVLDYDQHQKMSSESRILTCTTLAWMLCSPLVPLRDSATIAIVKLLDDNLIICIDLLKKFSKIDDLYLQERLYASVYGAVIRSNDIGTIHTIATYVFKLIFLSGNPPVQLMLRDYARSIIEYAYHLDNSINVDFDLVRPPYKTSLPNSLPSVEEVKAKYELEWNKDLGYNEKISYKANDAIFTSLIGMNADKNDIKYRISQFSKRSIKCHTKFESLKSHLNDLNSELLNLILTTKQAILDIELSLKRDGLSQFQMSRLIKGEDYSEEKQHQFIEAHISEQAEQKELLELYLKNLKTYLHDFPLGDSQNKIQKQEVVSNFLLIMTSGNSRYESTQSFKDYSPWIVQRIFELGYDNEFHGAYDGPKTDYYYMKEHYKFQGKSGLIGGKYERIAGQEILARLSDNFLMRKDWGDYDLYMYNFARYGFLPPDIDPSIVYYKSRSKKEDVIDNEGYNNWRSESWLEQDDWPSINDIVEIVDDSGVAWVNLWGSKSYKEPVKVGDEKYNTDKQEMGYFFRSYLVDSSQKDELISSIEEIINTNFWKLPDSNSTYELLKGEYYWSASFKEYINDRDNIIHDGYVYDDINGINVHIPVYSFYLSGIEFQENANIQLLSNLLYDQLKIDNIDNEGLAFKENEVMSYSQCNNRKAIWVRKDKLLEILSALGYDIVFVIEGEKLDRFGGFSGPIFRANFHGIYSLNEKGELEGDYSFEKEKSRYED